MGVVIVGSGVFVSIFSIERNERFRLIDIRYDIIRLLSCDKPYHLDTDLLDIDRKVTDANIEVTSDYHEIPVRNGNSNSKNRLWESNYGCSIKDIASSDFGNCIIYAEIKTSQLPNKEKLSSHTTVSLDQEILYVLMSYSVGGICTGFTYVASRVTCIKCPGRAGIATVGMEDGTVSFFHTLTLSLLFSCKPHENCVMLNSSGEVKSVKTEPATKPKSTQGDLKSTPSDFIPTSIPSSAIIKIKVGPKLDRPIIAAISNASGQVFILPFPDFVKYEKIHATSAFSQIVSAPIQAVKGTLQTAQNLTIMAGDAAGSLAQNAKGLADDALGEAQNFLKKVF
jgi:hypothetical protein